MKDQGWKAIGTQYRKASDILTSTLAAFFCSHPTMERDREAHESRDSWSPGPVDPGTRGPQDSQNAGLADMNRIWIRKRKVFQHLVMYVIRPSGSVMRFKDSIT